MRFYFVNAEGAAPYYTTMGEAKIEARRIAADSFHPIDVHQVEIATDRANILRLANVGAGTHTDVGIIYTAKGKLKS
jgi:hypothetical protein